MAARKNDDLDVQNTSAPVGDCAPLSQYLQTDSNDDGWTIVSSDDDLQARRADSTPNLSVLKSLKRLLSTETPQDDSFLSSNSDSNYRVDYPFYDGEPKAARANVVPTKPVRDLPAHEPIEFQKAIEPPEEFDPESEYRFVEEALLSPDLTEYSLKQSPLEATVHAEQPQKVVSKAEEPPLEPTEQDAQEEELTSKEEEIEGREEPLAPPFVEEASTNDEESEETANENQEPDGILEKVEDERQEEPLETPFVEETLSCNIEPEEKADETQTPAEILEEAVGPNQEEPLEEPQESVAEPTFCASENVDLVPVEDESEIEVCAQPIAAPVVVDFSDVAGAAFERLDQGLAPVEEPLVANVKPERKRSRRAKESRPSVETPKDALEGSTIYESTYVRRDLGSNSRLTIFHRFVDLVGKLAPQSKAQKPESKRPAPAQIDVEADEQALDEYGETVAIAIAPFVADANLYSSLDSTLITP